MLVCRIHWSYAQVVFLTEAGLDKDHTVWLDGARPTSKSVFKNNMSLTNSKIWQAQTLHKHIATFNFDKSDSAINESCGLYYKPMTIVNDDSRVIIKLEASLTDDTRVVIYDRHMFIVQATDVPP